MFPTRIFFPLSPKPHGASSHVFSQLERLSTCFFPRSFLPPKIFLNVLFVHLIPLQLSMLRSKILLFLPLSIPTSTLQFLPKPLGLVLPIVFGLPARHVGLGTIPPDTSVVVDPTAQSLIVFPIGWDGWLGRLASSRFSSLHLPSLQRVSSFLSL